MDTTSLNIGAAPRVAVSPTVHPSLLDAGLDDIRSQIRRIAVTPSPVSELLAEPALVKLLAQSSGRRSRSRSKSRTNSPNPNLSPNLRSELKDSIANMKDVKRKPKDDTSSILTVLAADAQQSAYLKHLLTTTSERLQIETQRAVQAEQVLQQSETRAREAIERAVAAERARHVTEIENARLGEETKRYKLHVDFIEQELRRTVADMQSLETQLEESKRVASRSRRLAEQYKDALTESRAREEGREEGKRIGLMRGYSDGRLKGWQAGKSEGFAQGRSAGIEQGRQEGEEVGRMDERERALQAFDRFLAGTSRGAGSRSGMSEASGEGANVSPRTRQWVNSPGQTLQEMSNIGTNIGYATTDGGQLPSPAASWIPPSEFDDYGFSDEE